MGVIERDDDQILSHVVTVVPVVSARPGRRGARGNRSTFAG